jgi:hypothetical protein
MKSLSILIGLFYFVFGFGQTHHNTGTSNDIVIVQKDSVTLPSTNQSETLKGLRYTFNGKALSFQVDTVYDNLIAFLKLKNGKDYNDIISYHPASDTINWRYNTHSLDGKLLKNNLVFTQYNAETNKDRDYFLDRKSGKLKYFIEGADVFQDPANDLVFAFPKYTSKHLLEIINEKSGSVLNKIKLPPNFYLSSSALHDSCIYLNINGIHVVDSHYKIVWENELNTMQLDMAYLLISAGFAIGIGVMTGYAPVISAVNYSANLTSDFHFSEKDVFISDKDRIYSFDKKSGIKNWQQKLPYKTGFSLIHEVNDSTLSFINTGLCMRNGQVQGFATPYHALINKNTGSIVKNQKITQSNYVADVKYKTDSALILFDNRICRINASDSVNYNLGYTIPESMGKGVILATNNDSNVFVQDFPGSKWHSLQSRLTKENDIIMVTSEGIIILNNELRFLKFFPISCIGKLKYENENSRYFEVLKPLRDKYVIPGGLVKYNKSDGTSIVFDIGTFNIIDNDKLYLVNKKNIDVFNL